uniref:Uncharacterized protein n=1 Tax=Timema douglasi TaxID=61478 RepID=A0A7R8VF64_TIMDO|nr:unnamed protein product [Timema douglasi]
MNHNPYRSYLKSLSVGGAEFKYYDLPALGQNYESLLCLTVQSALVSFLRTCTGRSNHPSYCLDRPTVHVF